MRQIIDQLLDCTPWYLFQVNPHGIPRDLCGDDCRTHRDIGAVAMEACECLTCHGPYSATRDPERLYQMWDEKPHGLLAVRTGLKSNLFVVDCDVHPGGANGIASLKHIKTNPQALPKTVTAATGGGGIHLFYRHPGEHYTVKTSQSKLAPGIDIKGENQFVVLSPSKKANSDTPYRWYPAREPWAFPIAMIDSLVGSLVIGKAQESRVIDVMDVDFRPMALLALEDALLRLKHAGPGERNARLFQAACRAGEAVYGGALKYEEAKSLVFHTGIEVLSQHEVKKTMRSGMTTGMADAARGYTSDVR